MYKYINISIYEYIYIIIIVYTVGNKLNPGRTY